MQEKLPADHVSPLDSLVTITNLAWNMPSALHGGFTTPWAIVGVPSDATEPEWLDARNHPCIVVLPYCSRHDMATAVVEPSYLSTLIARKFPVDLRHDPTQPSDTEIRRLGSFDAQRRARERWLQTVVTMIYSEYPLAVKQACQHHTRSRGWSEELDEEIVTHEISVSMFPGLVVQRLIRGPGSDRARQVDVLAAFCLLVSPHRSRSVICSCTDYLARQRTKASSVS